MDNTLNLVRELGTVFYAAVVQLLGHTHSEHAGQLLGLSKLLGWYA